jgi:hypothetical protein
MSSDARRITFFLVLAALAGTALIAVGLPKLRLSPGMPLPAVEQGTIALDAPGLPPGRGPPLRRLALTILATGFGLLLVHAVWRALRGMRLRSVLAALLRGLLAVGGLCLAVLAIVTIWPSRPAAPAPAPAAVEAPEPPRTPLGEPPSPVLWLTAAGLLAGAVSLSAWLLRRRTSQPDALGLVGTEAERARAALLAGDDPRSVILACYARMSAALAEEQGIERPGPMTAREFGQLLASLGVPLAPVQELTSLFEEARYGAWLPGAAEQARALDCLPPIVKYCRTARREG